jgi:hypothetical protein
MHCHGARQTDVVASIGGRPPHVWTVFYDEELAGLLLSGADRFWRLVEDGVPPPLDHTEASKAYLLSKYPCNADRRIIPATPEADAIAYERIEATRTGGDAERTRKACDARLLAIVGEADGIKGEGWGMTWKVGAGGVRRSRFTGKGLEE